MTSVHTERHIRILELCSGEEKFTPQFVVHTAMIVGGETTDVQGQLAWKKYLGLDYIATLSPYLREPQQVFERMDASVMHGRDFAGFVHMGADSDVNHAAIKADL